MEMGRSGNECRRNWNDPYFLGEKIFMECFTARLALGCKPILCTCYILKFGIIARSVRVTYVGLSGGSHAALAVAGGCRKEKLN